MLAIILNHLLGGVTNQDNSEVCGRLDKGVVEAYRQIYQSTTPRVIKLIAKDECLEEQIIKALINENAAPCRWKERIRRDPAGLH